jgi:hypothetical protein
VGPGQQLAFWLLLTLNEFRVRFRNGNAIEIVFFVSYVVDTFLIHTQWLLALLVRQWPKIISSGSPRRAYDFIRLDSRDSGASRRLEHLPDTNIPFLCAA